MPITKAIQCVSGIEKTLSNRLPKKEHTSPNVVSNVMKAQMLKYTSRVMDYGCCHYHRHHQHPRTIPFNSIEKQQNNKRRYEGETMGNNKHGP